MGSRKIKEFENESPKLPPPVPGSWLMRFFAWIWYVGVMSLYMGTIPTAKDVLHKISKVDYPSLPRRTGEVVVLTGGTKGIGTQVLKKLLQLDFTVIMGARSTEAGLKVVEKLRVEHEVTSGIVKCFPLDLKSLKTVRFFAELVLKETERIDLIVNNAGVMFHPWEVAEDNFEVHFQVNYLSHFLLTQILLPKMKETAAQRETKCRIVNVSSLTHYSASGKHIQHCSYPKVYCPAKAYMESKLCQVLFTRCLNKQLQDENANVSVYAVHPGAIATDLYDTIFCFGSFFKAIGSAFRSIDEGAEEIMLGAISPEFENEGGAYIQNSAKKRPSTAAENEELQQLLWDTTVDLLNRV